MPKRYVAELQRLQSDAAANYLLLQRLWQQAEEEQISFGLRAQEQDLGCLTLSLLEQSRWTQVLELHLTLITQDYLAPALMQVRVYQDLRLAEVIAYQKRQVREGRYAYPNAGMFHPDEKVQVNSFLKDMLQFTLDKGYSLTEEVSRD